MPSAPLNPAGMSVHVIANFGAGLYPRYTAGDILASFARFPQVTCRLTDMRDSPDISASVERGLEASADIVVAAGGDGTVSSVADRLVGKNVQLGVLPLGTLNHLAKDLGIPLDLDGAVDTICAGRTVRIDVGEVNGRYFINNCSLGAYSKAVQMRDRWRPFLGKWPAMAVAIVAILLKLPWFRIHMEWNGKQIKQFVPLLLVGNNPYETSWPTVGTRSVLNRGVLWLMLFKERRFFGMVKAAILALLGHIWSVNELEIVETTEFTVRTSRHHLTIALDGEILRQRTPLVFRSHPAALKVRVPEQTEVPPGFRNTTEPEA